jgi:hypothetical protein
MKNSLTNADLTIVKETQPKSTVPQAGTTKQLTDSIYTYSGGFTHLQELKIICNLMAIRNRCIKECL